MDDGLNNNKIRPRDETTIIGELKLIFFQADSRLLLYIVQTTMTISREKKIANMRFPSVPLYKFVHKM